MEEIIEEYAELTAVLLFTAVIIGVFAGVVNII